VLFGQNAVQRTGLVCSVVRNGMRPNVAAAASTRIDRTTAEIGLSTPF